MRNSCRIKHLDFILLFHAAPADFQPSGVCGAIETIILKRIEEWVTLLENPIASRAPGRRLPNQPQLGKRYASYKPPLILDSLRDSIKMDMSAYPPFAKEEWGKEKWR